MARTKLLVANWKLHHLRPAALTFAEELKGHLQKPGGIDVAIAPVATLFYEFGRLLAQTGVDLAAQDVFFAKEGAFTGEISAQHLKEQCVSYCIVGHSERRSLFFETDEDVGKKVKALLDASITPIVCVGETLAERENNQWKQVLERQIRQAFSGLQSPVDLVVAYEPVWAIGTGKAANPEDAEEAHLFIRQQLEGYLGRDTSLNSRIIYGGSVSTENLLAFVVKPNIDGALVGKASLQVSSFLSMVEVLGGTVSHL